MNRSFKQRSCKYCGTLFTPRSSGNVACSEECRFMLIKNEASVDDNGCWIWPRSFNVQTGYGQFMPDSRAPEAAHRASYRMLVGPITEGMHVCHTCDNHKCFNPDHLFLGTPKDNVQDMIRKGRDHDKVAQGLKYRGENHWTKRLPGRLPKGEQNKKSKLTEAAVKAIRESDETLTVLAKRYGVSETSVSYARRGKTWAHVQSSILAKSSADGL